MYLNKVFTAYKILQQKQNGSILTDEVTNQEITRLFSSNCKNEYNINKFHCELQAIYSQVHNKWGQGSKIEKLINGGGGGMGRIIDNVSKHFLKIKDGNKIYKKKRDEMTSWI